MTFERRIMAFSSRFLRERTFDLIVAPALADFQYEAGASMPRRVANYLAVLRAVAGGAREDFVRESGAILRLALLPACYYAFLILVCAELAPISTDFLVVAALLVVLSLLPVVVCYWPERPMPPAD